MSAPKTETFKGAIEKPSPAKKREEERSGTLAKVKRGLKIAAVAGGTLMGAEMLRRSIDPKKREAIKRGMQRGTEKVTKKAGKVWEGTKERVGNAAEASKDALQKGKEKMEDTAESVEDRLQNG